MKVRRGLNPAPGTDGRSRIGASTVVEEALTARRPRARYVVGLVPKLQIALMTNLPTAARDRVLRMVSGQP